MTAKQKSTVYWQMLLHVLIIFKLNSEQKFKTSDLKQPQQRHIL